LNIITTIIPDIKKLAQDLKGDYDGARRAGMINLVATLEARAVKNAKVKTGNMARSRTTSVSEDGNKGSLSFTAPYAIFVHEGTGLFGIYHRRIKPTTKKALFWPGARHPVNSTAGMKGDPFVTRAADETNATEAFQEGMRNYLNRRG
jgi:HK97 gp10 family phage protein